MVRIYRAIIFYFVSFEIALCNGDINEESFTPFSCSVFSTTKLAGIKCEIRFLRAKDTSVNCVHKQNSAVILVGTQSYHKAPLAYSSVSFTCTSNSQLSVHVQFKDGDPQTQYTEMRPEKIVEDPFDPSTSKYKLHIRFPSHRVYRYFEGDVVKYTIANVDDPTEKIHLLVEFYDSGSYRDTDHKYNFYGSSQLIISQDEMVYLPCIDLKYPAENTPIMQLRNEQGNLTVDNYSLSYDAWEGFRLNTSLFEEKVTGKYTCVGTGTFWTREFQIINSVRDYSPQDDMYLYGPKFNLMLGSMEKREDKGVTLSAYRMDRQANITLMAYFGDPSNPSVNTTFTAGTYAIAQCGQNPILAA